MYTTRKSARLVGAPLRALMRGMLVLSLGVAAASSAGCATRTWERSVDISLDVTRIAVDGSWALTIDHQRVAEEAAISAGAQRAIGGTPEERQAILADVQLELVLVRQRHHAWYGRYQAIRHLHGTAVAALEAYHAGRGTRGAVLAAMGPLLEAWRALQETLPGRGNPDAPALPASAGETGDAPPSKPALAAGSSSSSSIKEFVHG